MTTQNPPVRRSSLLRVFIRFREAGLTFFILILVSVVTISTPSFLSIVNLRNILLNISILAIVAIAQMIVILTRGIDLSVGSMIGLTAMMVAFIAKQYPNLPVIVSVVLGMALGAVLGTFNGLIITFGKVPPIIATLGTLSVYRGLVFFYSAGSWVNAYEFPANFDRLAKGVLLGLPYLVFYAVLIGVLAYYFLKYTRTGRDIYAVGSNLEAAQLSGIRPQRVIFLVYLISGIVCGLCGVLWASLYESAQTNTALGFELQTVAAAVVGGVSISGGVGTVPGVFLGTLLLGIVDNALTLSNISPFWQLAVQGLLILIAVVTDNLIMRRTQRKEGT